MTPEEVLQHNLWLNQNLDRLTLGEVAEAIEQLRPYIEGTMPEKDQQFLQQWNGLLWGNWHSLRLIQLQATAKVLPYQDEFNARCSRLIDLLSAVEFAVQNFDVSSADTRHELYITAGTFCEIRFCCIELKESWRRFLPWVLRRGGR